MNKLKTKTNKQSPSQNASGNCAVSSRSTPPSRNKSERDVPYEGIYQNLRFCETITSLMGNTVQIQLSNGKIFEGIFSTFSPQLEVVLELVHTVDPNQPDKIDVKTISKEVVFGSQLIVTMSSKDVELDYATKDTFATDNTISRFNGVSGEKELEPWEGDGDELAISLDDANGWDPNEMFAKNEKIYGVHSNFEEDLSQYTIKLERKDSAEFKEREAQASLLANSIEGNTSSKAQTELENASDEEEKFSAVVRPNHEARDRRDAREFRDFNNRPERGAISGAGPGSASVNTGGGKYVHPNKRPSKGMQNMGKMVRSTPPPHGGHGSHVAPRHQSVGGGGGGGSYHGGTGNYDGDGRGVHSAHPAAGSAHHGYHQSGAHQPFQSSQGRGPSSGGPYGYGHGQARAQGSSAYNNKMSAQQSESRLNGDERKMNRESPYESKGNHPSSHQHTPINANATQREHAPKEQRKSYSAKNRDDQHLDLKKFSQEFRLAETTPVEEKKAAAPSTTVTPSPTAAPLKTNSPPPPTPPAVTPSQPPPQVPNTPVASPVSQSVSSTTTAASSTVSPPISGREAATPVDDKAGEPTEKASDSMKKSMLNPNAKEFILNPNARVFIPTPPRSHTPQTPQSGQILMPAPMGSLGQVGPALAGAGSPGQGISLMPVVFANAQNQAGGGGSNQQHYAAHNQGSRFRKPTPMPVNHRPDLASSMHVAAATGQPLMAPAPMGGHQLFYPPQGAIIPGTQPYPHLYTMRVVGPQMQGMVPNSSYADSSTSGHGPIYMSPGGHGQGNNQGQMAPPQQQHHHPNSTPSPAQQHSMAQTQGGNPPQLIYQTAGSHHGHTGGPPHNHPHASFPMVFLPPGHSQLPPGVNGPGGPGGPQGVQILPLGSSTSAGMAAMGMAIPQIHYIQQAPGGNQAVHRLV